MALAGESAKGNGNREEGKASYEAEKSSLARPERLELPTYWFEASRSIHLSYGRAHIDFSKAADLVTDCRGWHPNEIRTGS